MKTATEYQADKIKSDIDEMRERIWRKQGWTDLEIEQEWVIRALKKSYRTPVQTLLDNVKERAELMKQLNITWVTQND